MEFRMEEWAMLKMKKGKRGTVAGIEVPNQENIRTPKRKKKITNIWKYRKQTRSNKQMKEKVTKEYLRKTRIFLETKLHNRNFSKRTNIVSFSGSLLE